MNDLIAVEKIAQWQKLKTLVLDSVSSPITKRVYNMALNEFLGWFQQAPRPGFTKATVSAWRVSLEDRGLGSSSIIIRMSAIRKLAAEAVDNGLLAPELAAGISRVKSAKTQGIRAGNWLSQRQAQALLSAPDITTLRGLRDRAILAVLLGCGLRRSEVAALTFSHLQQRDGRWCIVDLVCHWEARALQQQVHLARPVDKRISLNPLAATSRISGTPHGATDPFTFFKEPRPLGGNPHPPDSSLWHGFEQATHEAKKELDSLWSDCTRSFTARASPPEVLALILDARLKRLDIVADWMLRIFVADEETARIYEGWLADLMKAEEKDVLDLVCEEAPHYGEYFNREEFTQTLLLRQQGYKRKCDSKVIQLISGRRAARAAERATPSTQPKPLAALELISEAMNRQSLNAPKLAAEIQALLRRKPGARLKADRATIFRIVRGHTKWPNPALRDALIKVLQLPVDRAEIVRHALTRPQLQHTKGQKN